MVEPWPSKPVMRVRFPSSAPTHPRRLPLTTVRNRRRLSISSRFPQEQLAVIAAREQRDDAWPSRTCPSLSGPKAGQDATFGEAKLARKAQTCRQMEQEFRIAKLRRAQCAEGALTTPAPVAQGTEQRPSKPSVGGSNPPGREEIHGERGAAG